MFTSSSIISDTRKIPSFGKLFVTEKSAAWNGIKPKGLARRDEVKNSVKKGLKGIQNVILIIQI